MNERDLTRLLAWSHELKTVHQRLRDALHKIQADRDTSQSAATLGDDLLLFCHGFCTALSEHHRAEDSELFPDLAAARPELRGVLSTLAEDHVMIAGLLTDLQAATDSSAALTELDGRLDGIAAILESHFRYEEREVLRALDALSTDTDRPQEPHPG